MKTAALLLCPLLVAGQISIDYRAKQDSRDAQWREKSQWRCGHAPPVGEAPQFRDVFRPLAGIVELRSGSLDYLRAESEDSEAKAIGFKSLFCASYISNYRNPAHEDGKPGVCIRDASPGFEWSAIVQADRDAEQAWEHFGTTEGFQKSVGIHREPPANDPTLLWGSGNVGSVPNNWCGAYMREMLCHIAFPQFADNQASIANYPDNRGLGALIRPVSDSFCESVMNICNRHEPKPFKSARLDWLVGTHAEVKQDVENKLWCRSWNSGYNISQAAPGVGGGHDSDDKNYVAQWEASSSLTPLALFTIVAAVLAVCL